MLTHEREAMPKSMEIIMKGYTSRDNPGGMH